MTDFLAIKPRRLVVGMSGATGAPLAIRMLRVLAEAGIETHLIMSRMAEVTLAYESSLKIAEVRALAHVAYRNDDLAAAPSSGSFRTMGMVVVPCSMRALGEMAVGGGGSLLTRAADVTLKERRRLVVVARETPLTLAHLRAMTAVTEMGGIIAPPVPAFYFGPQTIDEMVDHMVGRVLDLFDVEHNLVKRWGETGGSGPQPR